MRFESKHRQSKLTANVTASRVNIPYTLALKHQLKLNQRFLHNVGLVKDIEVGPGKSLNIASHSRYDEFVHSLPESFCGYNFHANWVNVMGTVYKPKMLLILDIKDDLPAMGIILEIIIDNAQEVCFICYLLDTIGFDEHFQAFEIISIKNSVACYRSKDLVSPSPTFLVHTPNGKQYVSLRHVI
jgi:hypothetical protein